MSAGLNYNTKFAIGQRVLVKSGLFKGKTGIIKDYSPGTTRGLLSDNMSRKIADSHGVYTVEISWFKTIQCEEPCLEKL